MEKLLQNTAIMRNNSVGFFRHTFRIGIKKTQNRNPELTLSDQRIPH